MAELQDLEVHLATCADCAGELARYRGMLTGMASLRHQLEEVPFGFTEAVMARLAEANLRWGERVLQVANDHRLQVVAGALFGAATIGFIWWRAARRGVARAA